MNDINIVYGVHSVHAYLEWDELKCVACNVTFLVLSVDCGGWGRVGG